MGTLEFGKEKPRCKSQREKLLVRSTDEVDQYRSCLSLVSRRTPTAIPNPKTEVKCFRVAGGISSLSIVNFLNGNVLQRTHWLLPQLTVSSSQQGPSDD